jgi:hypothetical protein
MLVIDRTYNCFLFYVHPDKEIRVGEDRGNAVESGHRPIGLGKQVLKFLVIDEWGIWGQWVWDEGFIS